MKYTGTAVLGSLEVPVTLITTAPIAQCPPKSLPSLIGKKLGLDTPVNFRVTLAWDSEGDEPGRFEVSKVVIPAWAIVAAKPIIAKLQSTSTSAA